MYLLIAYAIGAAVLLGGAYMSWQGLKEHIAAPYVAAQIKSDQAKIDKADAAQRAAEAERDHAVSDTVACVSAQAKQTAAVDKWKGIADRNIVDARAAKARADKEAAAVAPKIATLQAQAAAAPKLMACEEELGKAKDVLRDALRARRGAAK